MALRARSAYDTVALPALSVVAVSVVVALLDPAKVAGKIVVATRVGSSGSGTSAEEVNLVNPAGGNYTVVVQERGVAVSSPFKLHTWLLGSTAAGNTAVIAPSAATVGTTATVNLTFSGLSSGTQYMGSVAYSGTAGLPNPTIVRVDTP